MAGGWGALGGEAERPTEERPHHRTRHPRNTVGRVGLGGQAVGVERSLDTVGVVLRVVACTHHRSCRCRLI